MNNITPTRRPKRYRRQGFALLVMLVVLTVTMVFAAIHQRHLSTALRIEATAEQHVRFKQGPLTAIARGLEMLETGTPPSSKYECGLSLTTGNGTRNFRLTFTQQTGSNWSLVATEADISGLPEAPLAFSQ